MDLSALDGPSYAVRLTALKDKIKEDPELYTHGYAKLSKVFNLSITTLRKHLPKPREVKKQMSQNSLKNLNNAPVKPTLAKPVPAKTSTPAKPVPAKTSTPAKPVPVKPMKPPTPVKTSTPAKPVPVKPALVIDRSVLSKPVNPKKLTDAQYEILRKR